MTRAQGTVLAWVLGIAVFCVALILVLDADNGRTADRRREHVESRAALAESIEGFRRCARLEP